MKKLILLAPLLLALGCPGEDPTVRIVVPGQGPLVIGAPPPPATPAPSEPQTRPAPPPRREPPLLIVSEPGLTQTLGDYSVTLARFAIQPRSEVALAAEPIDLSGYTASSGEFLSLWLEIERDGTPYSDLQDEGEFSVGAFALLCGERVDVFPPGLVEVLPDQPKSAYQWRLVDAPDFRHGALGLRVTFEVHGENHELEFTGLKARTSTGPR